MNCNFAVPLTEINLDFDVQYSVEHSIFFLFVQLLYPVKEKYEFLIYYFGRQQKLYCFRRFVVYNFEKRLLIKVYGNLVGKL